MLIALAFAVFGVAMLYYAVGIAQTVLLRQKLQDAADATALSAAVSNARSMNFLVLLNIIMAALLAVLIAFKLAETLAIIGIIIAAALSYFTFGASLTAIPPLKVVRSEMKALYDATKEPVYSALEVLHQASDAVVLVAPGAADAVARADLATYWQPEVDEQGAVVSDSSGLPVEDDTFDALCGRGGKLAADLAMTPLPGMPGAVKDAISDALGSLTSSMSDWFCGDSGGPPPSAPPQPVNKGFPRTESMDECQHEVISAQDLNAAQGNADGLSSTVCDESKTDVEAAEPDATTGGCKSDTDCSISGPYEQHAQLARQQCDPSTSPRPFAYRYQMQDGTVDYRYLAKVGWVRGQATLREPRLANTGQPACGPEGVHPTIAAGYEPRARDDAGHLQPLCSNEVAPVIPPLGRNAPTTVTVKFTNVNHVLSCTKRVVEEADKTSDDSSDTSSDDDANEKLPKRMKAGLVLGSDSFQTRVFVQTPHRGLPADRIVKLALWNAKAPATATLPGEALRRFGFAQSEYFYDGTEASSEWMWNMKWRARLRRFRLPEDAAERGTLWSACAGAFEDGALLRSAFQEVEATVAH